MTRGARGSEPRHAHPERVEEHDRTEDDDEHGRRQRRGGSQTGEPESVF